MASEIHPFFGALTKSLSDIIASEAASSVIERGDCFARQSAGILMPELMPGSQIFPLARRHCRGYNAETMSEIETRYQQTLEYLYSFVDFSLQRMSHYSAEQFDLARMWKLVQALDNPQQRYPVIHVAGTKGKGSVSALCASALRAAGYRVGLFTSPHLDDYAERIQINGQLIDHGDLVALVEETKPVIESIHSLSTFEITTGLAFLYFARQGVDVAVIEVGLGGRLDATNVVLPRVAVITSLSYDHTYMLGNTLAEIAGEKAGIIKEGVPLVLSPQVDEARQVVQRVARERHAPLVQVGIDVPFEPLSHSLEGQSLQVVKPDGQPLRLTIPLLGQHQVINAATAYAALQAASESGLKVSEVAIREGFEHVFWPGRFEILQREPPVVIDCAHNRDSARRLRETLDEYFPTWPVVMIFGASEDKDVRGMFTELMPRLRQIIAVKSFHPRAMEPQLLVDLGQEFDKDSRLVPDVADGLAEALRLAGDDALVLATGSIFVASGVRLAWQRLDRKEGKGN
jgi:dihydrofolate synthase/folylpolyglutamate synthase